MAEKNKPTLVDLTEKVSITATKKAKHLVPGEIYKVHPSQAELLKQKGWATIDEEDKEEKPEQKTE